MQQGETARPWQARRRKESAKFGELQRVARHFCKRIPDRQLGIWGMLRGITRKINSRDAVRVPEQAMAPATPAFPDETSADVDWKSSAAGREILRLGGFMVAAFFQGGSEDP